jgi:hypothetical protein
LRESSIFAKAIAVITLTILLTLIVWFVRGIIEQETATDSNARTSGAVTNVVLDGKGRATVFLGEVRLLVDYTALGYVHPLSSVPRDIFQFSICWPNADELKGCYDDRDKIRVSLQSRSASREFPYFDASESLAQSTRMYDGPFDTNDGLTSEYRIKAGGDARLYVIMEERPSGRYPLAECTWVFCKVYFIDRPGISGQYRFHIDHIDQFAEIDQAVRRQIDAFEPQPSK